MSLIPRNTSNSPTPFTPFSQDFWDHFTNLPWPFSPHFLSPQTTSSSSRTVPYSELELETSGNVKTRLECKELPEAHLIVAELPGVEKDEVEVTAEDGGVVRISGGGDGRFSWRMRLPEDAKVHLLSSSIEDGVLTVVVPKFAVEIEWDREDFNRGRDVRVVGITGSDE